MSTHVNRQTTTRSWRRRAAAVALTALVAAPLAACGEEPQAAPTAAEQVPALVTQLDRVDQALAARQFERARTLLERLTQQVIQAREAGSLDPAAADRILGAISRLRAQLPEPKPEPTPTVSVTVTPPPRNDDGGDGGDRGDEKDEEQKKAEEARKKAEEARKKAEEERRKEQEERRKDQEEKDDD